MTTRRNGPTAASSTPPQPRPQCFGLNSSGLHAVGRRPGPSGPAGLRAQGGPARQPRSAAAGAQLARSLRVAGLADSEKTQRGPYSVGLGQASGSMTGDSVAVGPPHTSLWDRVWVLPSYSLLSLGQTPFSLYLPFYPPSLFPPSSLPSRGSFPLSLPPTPSRAIRQVEAAALT